MHLVGAPLPSVHPADAAIAMLADAKARILAYPASHESAVEVDKAEVLQRIDMVAMTAAAILHRGPRPDLLASVQKDAGIAIGAATDAVQRATWPLGQQIAATLMTTATAMAPLAATMAVSR
jgi:hypothetical protein